MLPSVPVPDIPLVTLLYTAVISLQLRYVPHVDRIQTARLLVKTSQYAAASKTCLETLWLGVHGSAREIQIVDSHTNVILTTDVRMPVRQGPVEEMLIVRPLITDQNVAVRSTTLVIQTPVVTANVQNTVTVCTTKLV